ncbi:MAG TPA: LysM peptidoglycan-binding domain-containing protein [Candidatus Saccharimonadia bacterium]|nr:LysM peptidoglycan-binding domain-containing protein [Candidatus Saccharimonadia bacterium]
MDEFTVKNLLKKIRQHETTASALLGVVAVGLSLYALWPYFNRLKAGTTPPALVIASPLPMLKVLPTSPDLEHLPVQYSVQAGDSTTKISMAFYGSASYVPNIEKENNLDAGQKLTPGLVLTIPHIDAIASPTPSTKAGSSTIYRTLPGDTLWKLAQRFYGDGNKWTKIYNANKNEIRNPNGLEKGLTLTIPQ